MHQPLRRWCFKAYGGREMSQRNAGISTHCWRLSLHPSIPWSEGCASPVVTQLTFETESDPLPSCGVWASVSQGDSQQGAQRPPSSARHSRTRGRIPAVPTCGEAVPPGFPAVILGGRFSLTSSIPGWVQSVCHLQEGCSLKCPASPPGDRLREPTAGSGRWAPVPAPIMAGFGKLLGPRSS